MLAFITPVDGREFVRRRWEGGSLPCPISFTRPRNLGPVVPNPSLTQKFISVGWLGTVLDSFL